jgi:tetratricopeptide (TPR) repeat protein
MDRKRKQPRCSKKERTISRPLAILAGALLLATACSSSKDKSRAPGYMALFESGQFAAAYEAAANEANRTRGAQHDLAALIAGQSAYRLGKAGEAHRWLLPLCDNADAQIAGRACSALGSLAAQQGTHASAVEYFVRAGTRLKGDDAARALMYAGDARKAQGRHEEALDLYRQAEAKIAADDSLRIAVADRIAGRTSSNPTTRSHYFAIQAGAFARRDAAEKLADSLRARQFVVRIVPIRDKAGRALYAVRVGEYPSKAEAEGARLSIGKDAIVVEGQ